MKRRATAFTMIELLTVIAISAILLGLIAIPLIQSFNLTRAAQGLAETQGRARIVIEGIETDIQNAALVRDNAGLAGAVTVVVPGQNGAPEAVYLERARLDLFPPAQGEPGPGGVLIDPDTGKIDPTLQAPKGQVTLPVAPGSMMVRYFVGLRDPLRDSNGDGSPDLILYRNPYDGLLTARTGGTDNLFVLYRSEVPLTAAYFATDSAGKLLLDQPDFFALVPGVDQDSAGALTSAGTDKVARIRRWLKNSRIVSDFSRTDLITPVYDRRTRQVRYENNKPLLVSNAVFAPSRATSEAATALLPVRTGEETQNAQKLGPDVWEARQGAWSSLMARLWPSAVPNAYSYANPSGAVRAPWETNTPYLIARPRLDSAGGQLGYSEFLYSPVAQREGETVLPESVGGVEVFDIATYSALANDPAAYAFSLAVAAANARSGWLSNQQARDLFVPFAPEPSSGRVIASFRITEVGSGSAPTAVLDRAPRTETGAALTPNNDPSAGDSWAGVVPVNQRFNRLWNQWPSLAPNLDRSRYARRFVDLRVVPMPDGTDGPLNPLTGFLRAVIVPGSEVVYGPDQTPGDNYGALIRYERVTQRPVGPNQYLINYVDQPEPNYADLGFAGVPSEIYNPRYYDSNNLLSAVVQPAFRKGYLELNSRYGEPLPPGNIVVDYRFQFTEPNDVLSVDYDSSESIDVILTLRHYPQTNLPEAQSLTVKGSARVRNFVR